MSTQCRVCSCLIVFLLIWGAHAGAHDFRPAYLQISEAADGSYRVLWKQPALQDRALRLYPRLSAGALDRDPDHMQAMPGYLLKQWRIPAQSGHPPLAGQELRIQGLDATVNDVLVRVEFADGRRHQEMLKPDRSRMTIPVADAFPVAPTYFVLGVEHILMGIDHLAFVLGLLLLAGSRWKLLGIVTGFTIGHSITLAAVALHWIKVDAATVEALVALSILLLAVELARAHQGSPGITARYPWAIASSFGLLHGAAFAGALRDIGLPPNDVIQSLLFFNLGVEAGQVIFVAAAILCMQLLQRFAPRSRAWVPAVSSYAIGIIAASWLFERLYSMY